MRGDFPYPPEPVPAPADTSLGTNTTTASQEKGNDGGDKNVSDAAGNTEIGIQEDKQKAETGKNPETGKTKIGTKVKAEKEPGEEKRPATDRKTEVQQKPETKRNAMTGVEGSQRESGQIQTDQGIAEAEHQGKKEASRQIIVKRQEKAAGDENAAKEKSALEQETGSADSCAGDAIPPKNSAVTDYILQNTGMLAGMIMFLGIGALFIYLFWLHSAVLYCYDGGDAYQKLGLLRLKKEKDAFSLYLPDYLAEEAKSPRYRLLVKNRLVKRRSGMDLIVYNEEHKLRRPLEECVDFVL